MDSAYNQGRRLRMVDAKARVIDLISEGSSVKDAMEQVGRHMRTYDYWRTRDGVFARNATSARLGKKDRKLKGAPFIDFRRTYFHHDTPWHHAHMFEAMEKTPPGGITMILAPPEAGKTSFFVDYVCWRIALNPDYRVGFISESAGHARKLVGQIARRMTDTEQFPNYIRRYGPFYEGRSGGKTWTQNQLLVSQSGHDEKDPTVEARGAGAQIYGARLDDIVFDDIQSTQSLNETEKLLRYFRQDALTRIKRGRLFIIGTRVGPGDFYETLMDLLPSMQVVKIRALDTGPEGLGPFTSYWPEHWPLDELLQRKEMLDRLGGDTWARVYQQDPVSEATATFTTEALANARTKERRIGQPAGVEVIMSLDPNLGVGVNALTVWGMDANRLYLIDIATRAKVARTEDIVAFLGEYAARYRPTTLIIEHNRERGLPTDEWLVAASKHYGFRIMTHQTSGNKINPIYGVASMAGGFSHGEISVPDMDEESRERLVPYMQELIAWRPDVPTKLLKQDLVMSGWFAWLHWLEHKDAIANRNRPRQLWRPSWLAKQPA